MPRESMPPADAADLARRKADWDDLADVFRAALMPDLAPIPARGRD